MSGLTVPDDWNEISDGFCTLSITVPNSPKWRANVKGQLLYLIYPNRWDAATGDTNNAALIGIDIFDSINLVCP